VPIIKPEVQKILSQAGLVKEEGLNKSVEENLSVHGLDNNSLAESLCNMALNSTNDIIRLRALETALKIKRVLQDQPAQLPNVTLIIQNSSADLSLTQGINPILFPRQSLKNKDID